MVKQHSIELDFVSDADTVLKLQDLIKAFASPHGCKGKIIEPVGPGGGWPLVKFTGCAGAIKSLLADYASGPDELGDLLDEVDPSLFPLP